MIWVWFLVPCALAVLIALGDRALLALEARGWIYYRKRHPDVRGAAGNALFSFESFLQPGARHVQVAKLEAHESESDEERGGES